MVYSQNKSKRQKQEILDRILDLEEHLKNHIIFQKQTTDDIISKIEQLNVRVEHKEGMRHVLSPG
jgi:hypothetical protein